MCNSVLPKVGGEAISGVESLDLDKIWRSAASECVQTQRKHTATQHTQIPYAQGGCSWGDIRARMCNNVLPKVEGDALGGVESIDLDKIYPSVSLEAKQTQRDFYFAKR